MNSQTQSVLEGIVRREGRSLLQYVRDAFPWTTPGERDALARLRELTAEDCRAAASLAQFLAGRGHRVPYLGSYPMAFTNINYVSLEHLLPMLVDYERRAVTELEGDLAGLTDAEVRARVEPVLAMKRRHLEALEALAAAHPETMSTVR